MVELGPDGDVADDHRLGVDERFRVDGGDEVSELVDGHGPTLRHGPPTAAKVGRPAGGPAPT